MGKHSRFNAGRLFKPTDDQRRQVLMMTGFGILQEDIAIALRIDKKTLYKHFRRELDTGRTEANVRVAQALYTNATKHMSVSAQIWWTKARMGWREPPRDVIVGGDEDRPLAVSFEWAPAQTVATIEATVDTVVNTALEIEWQADSPEDTPGK